MRAIRALILLAGAAASVAVGACTPDDDDVPFDAGTGLHLDGGGPTGETCDDARRIDGSGQVDGDTTGAADDVQPSCGFQTARDLVHRIDLAETSGLRVSVAGYDAVLVLVDATCTFDETGTHELACVDSLDPHAVESFAIGELAAGTYFIVLDGFDGSAGAYTLDVEIVPGGFCTGDSFDMGGLFGGAEDNDVPARAIGLGAADFSTLDDPATTDFDESIPLVACEGDTDVYVIGHMGGPMTVDVDGADAALSVAQYTVDTDALVATVTGAGAAAALTGDLPRGLYVLAVTSTAPGALGAAYSIDVVHGCLPDGLDDPVPQLDVAGDTNGVGLLEPLARADARTICGGDVDTFVLTNVLPGDVTMTLTGGAALGVQLARVDIAPDGARTVVPLAAPGDYTAAVVGAALVVTVPAAVAARYELSVSSGDPPAAAAVDYAFNATFAGIAAAPANDLCAGNAALTPAGAPTPVFGRTITGADNFVSPCGGDGAPDVFYSFHTDAPTNALVRFDGTATDFTGAVTLLRFPGSACPADLTTLLPVQFGGAPLCREGEQVALRAAVLAAGDYLVVVDGTDGARGAFQVSVETYADALPPLAACAAATPLPLPAVGQTTTVELSYDTTSQNEISYYPATCLPNGGGTGGEKVYTLAPTVNVKVKVTTAGYDTVAAILQGACDGVDFIACNDDDAAAGDFNSAVEAVLTAGQTYFLVVDAYDPVLATDAVRATTLTIVSSAP